MSFTSPVRHKMVRWAQAHLKSFVVTFSLGSYLPAVDAAAHLDGLNAMCTIGSRGSRGQVAVLNKQKQGKHSYCSG